MPLTLAGVVFSAVLVGLCAWLWGLGAASREVARAHVVWQSQLDTVQHCRKTSAMARASLVKPTRGSLDLVAKRFDALDSHIMLTPNTASNNYATASESSRMRLVRLLGTWRESFDAIASLHRERGIDGDAGAISAMVSAGEALQGDIDSINNEVLSRRLQEARLHARAYVADGAQSHIDHIRDVIDQMNDEVQRLDLFGATIERITKRCDQFAQSVAQLATINAEIAKHTALYETQEDMVFVAAMGSEMRSERVSEADQARATFFMGLPDSVSAVLSGVGAVIVAVLCLVYLARMGERSILAVDTQLDDVVGTRDLSREIRLQPDSPAYGLSSSINSLLRQMRTVIGSVRDSSSSMGALSGKALAMGESCRMDAHQRDEELARLEEDVERLMESAGMTSRQASAIASSASDAQSRSQRLKECMHTSIATTTNCVAAVRSSKESIERLADHGSELDRMACTVAALADQTKVLALNVAIEAARAGEVGRGFVVIAEEVRSLAERITQAIDRVGTVGQTVIDVGRSADRELSECAAQLEHLAMHQRVGSEAHARSLETLDHLTTVVFGLDATSRDQQVLCERTADRIEQTLASGRVVTQRLRDQAAGLEHLQEHAEEMVDLLSSVRA